MQRPVAGKRIATALATASLAAALGAAGAAPVQAADQSTTPEPVSFVIDFTTTSIPQVPSLGGGFAGNGPVTDALGRRIGITEGDAMVAKPARVTAGDPWQ